MFLQVRIRMKLEAIFRPHGFLYMFGSGLCSKIYNEGVHNNLSYIKKRGLSSHDAAIYCIKKTLDENAFNTDPAYGTLLDIVSREG
mgnify:CR=1 FL=1